MDIPGDLTQYRDALLELAERAPEVHALSAGDVLSVAGGERAEILKTPSV